MNLKDYIRSIPDYPKKGILFRDITTLIKDENANNDWNTNLALGAEAFAKMINKNFNFND